MRGIFVTNYNLGIVFFLQETKVSEKPFLVQKTNDYLQSLRVKWEEKERELLSKNKDIHYQDVLFDGELNRYYEVYK